MKPKGIKEIEITVRNSRVIWASVKVTSLDQAIEWLMGLKTSKKDKL